MLTLHCLAKMMTMMMMMMMMMMKKVVEGGPFKGLVLKLPSRPQEGGAVYGWT
jgi:hypothetical protein